MAAGETMAAMRSRLSERQREVLDRVCGQDMSIRQAAAQLKMAFVTARKVLAEGLDVAGICLELQHRAHKVAGVPPQSAVIARATQVLAQVRF